MAYEDEIKHLQSLIRNRTRRFQKLKEKQALEGSNISPEHLIEIEDIEREIEQLQQELQRVESRRETSPPPTTHLPSKNSELISRMALKRVLGIFITLLIALFLTFTGYLLGIKKSEPTQLASVSTSTITPLITTPNAILSSFEVAENLKIVNIERKDTDGDGFNEWITFYKFKEQGDLSPIQGVIYDNDRGNPPAIFPYHLLTPGRNYLSDDETKISLKLIQVTQDQNGPEASNLPEILIEDMHTLIIFRFRQNSETSDFPRDAPPRYQCIGFFRGDGEVKFDEITKQVTVIYRGDERSQLVNRAIYALNLATNTYWDQFYEPTDLDRKLAAPIISTIDFLGVSPNEIINTDFPERIVIAFYASICGTEDSTLCRHANANWSPQNFLTGDALENFTDNKSSYFGVSNLKDMQNISISNLHYYPQMETDNDLLTTGGARDTVMGEQSQSSVVDINLATGTSNQQNIRFALSRVGGQWKINRRLPWDMPGLGNSK